MPRTHSIKLLSEPYQCQDSAAEVQELMKSATDSFKMSSTTTNGGPIQGAESADEFAEEEEVEPEPTGVTPGSSRQETDERKFRDACVKARTAQL